MDNKNNMYPNPPDADVPASAPPSYEVSANYHHQQQQQVSSSSSSSHQHHNSSSMMPSAPPSIPPAQPSPQQQHHHFSYGSMHPQPIYSYQNAHYQHQLQQQQQSYEEPPQQYRYIIHNRDRGDRHFPVNAALFVLGCKLVGIHSVYHLFDSTHAGRTR
ncbi:hypothetical protein MBANPS3_005413 [Mucor bainieri]